MQPNYGFRVGVIIAIVLLAVWAIFPGLDVTDPNLKPGIDMVGGTSLLYEIKPPEGSAFQTGNLAEEVMTALKKRVDPDGVKNLIWRPQGNTRLEIQMPLSGTSEQAKAAREAFAEAQRELEATNVRPGEVMRAVEQLKGDARRDRLNQLVMGSDKRSELFGALASVYDARQQARADQNFEVEAAKNLEYRDLQSRVDDTNLSPTELQASLDLTGAPRDKKLAELKQKAAGFDARLKAIDKFVNAYKQFNQIKGSLDDAADLKRLLKGSGVLEFHILATDTSSPEAQAMIARLHQQGPRAQAGDTMRWYQVDRPDSIGQGSLLQDFNEKKWALASITSDKSMASRAGAKSWALERAYPSQGEFGTPVVGFRFNAQGAQYFSDLTGANIGQPLAIVLDEKIISAPNIQSQIGRDGIITGGEGGFTQQELRYLISTLNAGSLPAQLAEEPISERQVGPQLGKDNLRAGLIACIFGLVVVAVFLSGYYYLAGVVATIAVMLNMILILGTMAAFQATFTLPGIAGIVLTIGMAVDANVLIFERLREEQVRGLSLRMALKYAYDKAFSAIFDSNVTTAITAAILYWFGSEEVKGFGLTLLIGIVWSLFTALFVTRTLFGILIEKFGVQKLSSLPLTFPKWDKMLRPNIDWMGKAWIAYTFSIVFIVVGMAAFVVKWQQGQMLDIEFASGTAVQFDLKSPMPIGEVRELIKDVDPDASVVAIGTNDKVYEVVTPKAEAAAVRDEVLRAMGDRLNIPLPSTFAHAGESFEQVTSNNVLVPIASTDVKFADDFAPEGVAAHVGGAAIVLDNIEPALSPDAIRARIETQRLQPQSGRATAAYRKFTVESPGDPTKPTNFAVVLVSDPAFPYDEADPIKKQQWQDELAAPMWSLVNEAVNRPATLQKVSNFDAQVAGEAQRDAWIALTLSVLVIMAYIWIRFGNLKFGTATVIALLHDTLFVLAAVGVAHYIADTAIGRGLLIEPFRINLTMVAAVLTVMGYSMNDTVVVFDRIRENRGKYGVLSRTIINDSINQTLSRTLLTGGTTIVTIFVMYVFGGPGIHGFTFALLVGILVGTYSSICIAAPILLLGAGQEQTTTRARQPVASAVQRVGA